MSEVSIIEYGKLNNMTDDELVAFFAKELNMPEEDVWLMLAIERGETNGDLLEGEE